MSTNIVTNFYFNNYSRFEIVIDSLSWLQKQARHKIPIVIISDYGRYIPIHDYKYTIALEFLVWIIRQVTEKNITEKV